MEQVFFGIHTGTCKHVITLKESNSLKQFFGVDINRPMEDETHFYDKGITKLWIQQTPTKRGLKCYLFMQINFTRVLGIGTHKIMPYSIANVKKAVKAVNKVLKLLPLLDKNNKFQDWTVERIDTAFDIREQNTPLLMQLLNDSLDLSKRIKQCERLPIPNKTPEQLKSESMRFGNDSYVYNGYVKLAEVLEKAEKNGRTVSQEEIEEVQDILRIERQNHKSAVKELLPHKKVNDLTNANVHDDILKTMISEMETFFGKGDFYSWKQIKKTYLPAHEADILKILDVMMQITNNSLEAAQDDYTKVADTFNRLGLSPVGIKENDAEKYKVERIQGIYNRITAEYPSKRQYNNFPIHHQSKTDGRIGANIPLYSVNSDKRTISIKGNSVEDYENKVFRKLRDTYMINRLYLKSDDASKRDIVQKSADVVKRFHRAAKTATVKQDADNFIKTVILLDEKRYTDCPSAADGGLTVSAKANSIESCSDSNKS